MTAVVLPHGTLGVSILGEVAEPQAERFLIRVSDILVAQVDHLGPEQRVPDLRELRIR